MTTIVSGPAPRRVSKLLEAIRYLAARPGGGRVGFRPKDAERGRRALLVASFAQADSRQVASAVAAGANAVEVRVASVADLRPLESLIGSAAVPLGIDLQAGDAAAVADKAAAMGVDWIRLPMEAPVVALEWERPARIITLPDDLDLRLVAALGTLQVDAVVAESADLSIGSGLRLRAIADLAKKPLLLSLAANVDPAAAAACDHLGVDALLVGTDSSGSAERLSALSAALQRPATGA